MADVYVCSHGKAGQCDECDELYPPLKKPAPEQVVLETARHDNGFRQWLIEQLTCMDGADLRYQAQAAKLHLAREAAYEIIGLMNPDIDRVEQVIRKYFLGA